MLKPRGTASTRGIRVASRHGKVDLLWRCAQGRACLQGLMHHAHALMFAASQHHIIQIWNLLPLGIHKDRQLSHFIARIRTFVLHESAAFSKRKAVNKPSHGAKPKLR